MYYSSSGVLILVRRGGCPPSIPLGPFLFMITKLIRDKSPATTLYVMHSPQGPECDIFNVWSQNQRVYFWHATFATKIVILGIDSLMIFPPHIFQTKVNTDYDPIFRKIKAKNLVIISLITSKCSKLRALAKIMPKS